MLSGIPLQLGVTVLAGLQVLLFFLLSYGKVTNLGKLGYAMFDYDASGVTLWSAIRMLNISGKASGDSGAALVECLIILVPLALSLAVLVLNVLSIRKIKDLPQTPKLSMIFSIVNVVLYILIRIMLGAGFGDSGVAEMGIISTIFILLVSGAQLYLAFKFHAESKTHQPV